MNIKASQSIVILFCPQHYRIQTLDVTVCNLSMRLDFHVHSTPLVCFHSCCTYQILNCQLFLDVLWYILRSTNIMMKQYSKLKWHCTCKRTDLLITNVILKFRQKWFNKYKYLGANGVGLHLENKKMLTWIFENMGNSNNKIK